MIFSVKERCRRYVELGKKCRSMVDSGISLKEYSERVKSISESMDIPLDEDLFQRAMGYFSEYSPRKKA